MATLEFAPVGKIVGIDPALVLVAFCIDREGGVTTMWAPDDSGDGPFAVHRRTRTGTSTFTPALPKVRFPLIAWDPGRDELYVVDVRSDIGEGTRETTAWSVSSEGAILRAGTVGDGIEDISVDAASRLFVSYFDEGVFGGEYWGPNIDRSPSSHGIARFDRDFRVTWMLPFSDRYRVDDCYAFTVENEIATLFSYSEFTFILRSDGESVDVWPGLGRPSSALVATGAHVGLIAPLQRSLKGVLVDLETSSEEELTVLVDGRPLDDRAVVKTHGHRAALVHDRTIYVASLLDIRDLSKD